MGMVGRPKGWGAWGPGGCPRQRPSRLEPSSQERLGQAPPGWEAGGTSAAGPLLPRPEAHVAEGCPGDGEPRVCVEPDRGGRDDFPRRWWRQHLGPVLAPSRFGGAGQIWRVTPSATPCAGMAVKAFLERLLQGGLPAPASFPGVCAASWTVVGSSGQKPGGTRAREWLSDEGQARLRDVGTCRQGHAACRSKSQVVPERPAFGTDLGTPGPETSGSCGRPGSAPGQRLSLLRHQRPGSCCPSPRAGSSQSQGPRAAGCASFRGCQWEAGRRAGVM